MLGLHAPQWRLTEIGQGKRLADTTVVAHSDGLCGRSRPTQTRCCATDARPSRGLLAGVDPVLHFERRHALEFRHVVRDQHQAFAACVACNVQVIHPDGLAEFFQGAADGTVVLGGLGAVGQNFQAAAKVLDGGQVI